MKAFLKAAGGTVLTVAATAINPALGMVAGALTGGGVSKEITKPKPQPQYASDHPALQDPRHQPMQWQRGAAPMGALGGALAVDQATGGAASSSMCTAITAACSMGDGYGLIAAATVLAVAAQTLTKNGGQLLKQAVAKAKG